jgi:hypothetical protein
MREETPLVRQRILLRKLSARHHRATVTEMADEMYVSERAIRCDRRASFMTYQSLRATDPVTSDLFPNGLTCGRDSKYLTGVVPDHRKIRHCTVTRIEDAVATRVHFQTPEDFDVLEHRAKSCDMIPGDGGVCVQVWFAASLTRSVAESNWRTSQQLTPQEDGCLLAESGPASFEVKITGSRVAAVTPWSCNREVCELRSRKKLVSCDISVWHRRIRGYSASARGCNPTGPKLAGYRDAIWNCGQSCNLVRTPTWSEFSKWSNDGFKPHTLHSSS